MEIHENLRQICNLIKKQINISLNKYDLTFSQSNILMYLFFNRDKKINQRQIEKEFDLTNPTVNGILNRLEQKQLIERVCDEEDKRIKNICLLPKFYGVMDEVIVEKNIMETNMLKGISNEEIVSLEKILKKINNNLKENLDERNI